jgi:hypothetical protein
MPVSQHTHDGLGRWAQATGRCGARLVRITRHDAQNRYLAGQLGFDASGGVSVIGTRTLTVTNLAEPLTAGGAVPDNTDAVALDVAGRWVVFLLPEGAVLFPARIVAGQGGAAYTVREQASTGAGTFQDVANAAEVTAHNLAEVALGPGGAVENGALVLITAVTDTGTPPTLRYVFDRPAYAKYLD